MSNASPLHHLYSTARWRKKRAAQLAREPLCWMCEQLGKVVAATVADHWIPHKGDECLFWEGELRSTCKTCHDAAKKSYEMAGKLALRGCDVDGYPLDDFGRSGT